MDFHLKQWRNQQYESEEEQQNHSAKIPKLHHSNNTNNNTTSNPHETQYQKKPVMPISPESALPLFVPQQQNKLTINNLSLSAPTTTTTTTTTTSTRLPRNMGSGYFSRAQWQELELQALIFRYMLAGAAVPGELLQPIKKSLANLLINTTPHYFLHNQHPLQVPYYPHYQPPALFQSGYWGRAAMDPEPGRCRRTDGKKWRCSRDVVMGQKYCERHVHRGRNRSRKPVETPTTDKLNNNSSSGGTHFALSGKAQIVNPTPPSTTSTMAGSVDLLRLSRSSSDVKLENKPTFEPNINISGESKSDGHVLRHFFDDWPRSRHQELDATTSLSISMPGNDNNNVSSDVSLKLSTGDAENGPENSQAHWASGAGSWASGPMGGPLAEALRSASSNINSSSPTSVLHPRPSLLAHEVHV